MARISRKKSSSGLYHVILRGVNRQDIFFDDEDRQKMLECLSRFQIETDIVLLAYCLMRNHIHLLIQSEADLSLYIKKLASSYVFFFNHKYERTGHLFQGRFRSEPIENDQYLLAVFRYILQNPWKAGICRPDEYLWNSWTSLTGKDDLCDIKPVIDTAGSLQQLKEYLLAENKDRFLEDETYKPFSESEAMQVAQQVFGEKNLQKITQCPKNVRDEILFRMKIAGISVRQISQLTGLSRNIIQRANESRNLSS